MTQPHEQFCLDNVDQIDMPESSKIRNRAVGYIATFLVTFVLGTTEIFAPWYAGLLGGTNFEVGWAMGSFGIVYMFSPAIGGKFSDRIGRKRSIGIGTIAYIGVLFLFINPLATPMYLIAVRALEGLVYGLITPSIEGMVAELSPEAECTVLGNFATSWSAGMILSPFVIAYMAGLYGNVSSIYVTIAVEFVSLGIIGFFMHGYRRKRTSHHETSTAEAVVEVAKEDEKGQKTSPIFIASYLSIMLWGVISTVILSLFPTYVENLPGFVTEDFGYLLMAWNGIRTVAFIICARLPEHLMDELIVLGALLSAISSAIIFLTVDFWAFMVAMLISGVAVGFNYLGALYLVVSATKLEKGAHAGLVESMGGVGLFLGPILGGWLMDFSLGLPYLMCTVLSLAVLVLMIVLLRRNNAQ